MNTSTTISLTIAPQPEATSVTETITSAESFDLHLDTQAFKSTLPIMGKGMLGIFAVIIVISLCVVLLNKVTGKKK